MARVVTLSELPGEGVSPGVVRASVTGGQTRWMDAELLTLAAGAAFEETAPAGSDTYLFILSGAARLTAGSVREDLAAQTAAVIEEGVALRLENVLDGQTRVLRVLAPPQGAKLELDGFTGGVAVTARADLPRVDVPEQKKKRYYIVSKESAKSQRGHAMIVEYQHDTVTALHHHPNADSMFVMLEGEITFVVDGKEVVVRPGDATVFRAGDIHSLRCAPGITSAGFLEFHVPAAFTTVKE